MKKLAEVKNIETASMKEKNKCSTVNSVNFPTKTLN